MSWCYGIPGRRKIHILTMLSGGKQQALCGRPYHWSYAAEWVHLNLDTLDVQPPGLCAPCRRAYREKAQRFFEAVQKGVPHEQTL